MDEEIMQYMRGQVADNAPEPVTGDVLGLLAGQGVQDGTGSGSLPDSYRPASANDMADGKACGNCRFFMDGWCAKYDAPCKAGGVCDGHEPVGGAE